MSLTDPDAREASSFLTALAETPVDRIAPEKAIVAHGLTKIFHSGKVTIKAVDNVSFRVATGDRIGILGANGAGKSTLINLIAGVASPTHGYVHRGMTMSWPLAIGGGFFEGHLTGYDNVRFLSKLYGRPFQETYDFVIEFSELTRTQMQTPVIHFSSGMKARLAFGLSLSIDFDCILIDEVIVVGDRRFQAKCMHEVFERRPDRSIILAVHDPGIVKEFCDSVLIMKNGRGRIFDDLDLAANIYNTL